MTEDQIILHNTNIAKLLGATKCKRCDDCGGFQFTELGVIIWMPKEMGYHNSWTWLIPAWTKIMDMIYQLRKDDHIELKKYYSDMELFNHSVRTNNVSGAYFILASAVEREAEILIPKIKE